MKYREVTQHHRGSYIVILTLILLDIFAVYFMFPNLNIHFVQFTIFIIGMNYIAQGYNPSPTISRKGEIQRLIRNYLTMFIIYSIYSLLILNYEIEIYSNLVVVVIKILSIVIFSRLLIRSIQKQLFRWGYGLRQVIIFGSDEDSIALSQKLAEAPTLGYSIIGYVADKQSHKFPKEVKYLGTRSSIREIVNSRVVDDIIISASDYSQQDILTLIGEMYDLSVCIKVLPHMYHALTGQVKMSLLHGIALIDVNPHILTEYQRFIKRIIDIIISSILLFLLFPLHVFIAVIIRLTSQGPILYTQARVGRHEHFYTLYKFRTMYNNSEAQSGPVWATENDPRITKTGHWLRKFRLDEIPQLVNVLKGEMSIVGPRPERPYFVEKLKEEIPYYARRFCIRPGITGWAQVVGEYDTTIENVENKLKLDFYYIENISLLLDIKIMFLTIITVLKGKGR